MKFTEIELVTQDIDWFAVDSNGHIGHFTSGGQGFIPSSVIASVENNTLLSDYFYAMDESTDVKIIEDNLPEFLNEKARETYLISYKEFASKGLYSFDINEMNSENEYLLIAKPQNTITINMLPLDIQEALKLTSLLNRNFDNILKTTQTFFE